MENQKDINELLKKQTLNEEECEFIGSCYQLGDQGVEKDIDKAIEYYEKGGGYYNTWKAGTCYFEKGSREFVLKGIDRFIEANSMSPCGEICYQVFLRYASLGDIKSAYDWLDNTFYNYSDIFESPEEETNNLLLQSLMLFYGVGVEKNEIEAFGLLKKYVNDGLGYYSGRCRYYLGLWAEGGCGIEKSNQTAIDYYESSDYDMPAKERAILLKISRDDQLTAFFRLFEYLCPDSFRILVCFWYQANNEPHPFFVPVIEEETDDSEGNLDEPEEEKTE
ncbi:MAG: hypothetical protein K6F32_05765 [Bacilli bacterium]|nr:hypothetical protein [Bacilli bacterium]